MASSLGIYVDKNIIKYAKITRDKEELKVDAFGIKIYTNLEQTINQIVSETFSFKVPISINLSEEMYDYFYMSNLLNSKDLDKAIETEFESLCYEKQNNPNAIISRYALVNDEEEKEKIKVINVSVDKAKIGKITQLLDEKRIGTITPISMSIPNIAPLGKNENTLIVNLEDVTTVTTLIGQKVYNVSTLQVGAGQILDKISSKVNSYAKAYEICKNTTIYTMDGQELKENESEYLEDIVPILYTIASQVRDIIGASLFKVNKVFITGTGCVINNIDLYFEEIIGGVECEILKPYFLEDNRKINMKDYIEVNSAIALALQGLGYGIKEINFNKKSIWQRLPELLSSDVTVGKNSQKSSGKKKINIGFDITGTKAKTWITRDLVGVLVLLIAYFGVSFYIGKELDKKNARIASVRDDINKQMNLIQVDTKNVKNKTSEYTTLTTNLKNIKEQISSKQQHKNSIPNFLNGIMYNIPQQVQLTSIENTSGKKIVIQAQSERYEQLAYFKALLKSSGVLDPSSVVSSEATKEGNVVKITIEGNLPIGGDE